MKGTTPVFAAFAALFLLAFFGLRSASTFLAAERESAPLQALAQTHGLQPAVVFALREQAVGLAWPEFAARVEAFVRCRGELGDELAAVAVAGGEAAARAALAGARGDPQAAWRVFRVDPAALAGVRFAQMRARFAGRLSAAGD